MTGIRLQFESVASSHLAVHPPQDPSPKQQKTAGEKRPALAPHTNVPPSAERRLPVRTVLSSPSVRPLPSPILDQLPVPTGLSTRLASSSIHSPFAAASFYTFSVAFVGPEAQYHGQVRPLETRARSCLSALKISPPGVC